MSSVLQFSRSVTVRSPSHPQLNSPQTVSYLDSAPNNLPTTNLPPPVLVLLHGFLGKASCWQPLMAQLPHRCIALDLLGFGQSSKPKLRYDVALEVAFVHAVLQSLQIEQVCLVGHSFGGWVAAAYALAYPAQVQGLILAAPAGIRDDSFCGRYDHLRPLLWPTPVIDAALWAAQPLARLAQRRSQLDQLRWFRRELMAEPAACSFLLDRLRPEDAIDTVESQIQGITAPTLVLTGDRDDTIPLWHCQTYAERIPQAQLTVFPDADHALPQDHADKMAAAIQAFVPVRAV
jgi:pimeloyl-ACP methyl ester carboxylesterase